MFKKLKKPLGILLSVALVTGTAVMTPIADIVGTSITASAAEKELDVGTEFYVGDTLNTNGYKYVVYNNIYDSNYSFNNSAVVPAPTYRKSNNYWYFTDIIRSGWGFTLVDKAFSGTETVTGFRCVSGDGLSSGTAFKFDLIYDNETDTCEMDFSDVAESLVSIKDADENTVSLNNGKATIKAGYVITSSEPLSFPRTYAEQQTDENNFVYVIKNMIQSEKKVAYDTSAFKGTVTSYDGNYGVTVEGYEGKSVQLFSRTPYYNQSVTVDFSHGTVLTGRNDYYDAPLDEFFDIYNADGENITNLFEFSNMAGSYYNYYYYKLKQNLETDVSVFRTGTQFSLILAEGVKIENTDIVTAQDGNKYTIRPAAAAILSSDHLISLSDSNGNLSVKPTDFKKVVNGRYVYEVKVITEFIVNTANIITTQEELNNARVGDIVMPAATLSVNDAGYNNIEYREYFNNSGRYWAGSGSGYSLNGNNTATIEDTLSIKISGNHKAYPVNVGKHESDSDYNVDEDKGNAWLIIRSQKGENDYWKTLELTGFNLDIPDYQFNWSDDNSTATVTFNNEQPVDADVTREADSTNSQWLYTAVKEYNGIPYIETKSIKGYTVEWKKDNDTILETDENVETGTIPTYDGAAPEKDEDDTYTYTFAGWTDGKNTYAVGAALPNVIADVTYTAVFEGTMKPEAAVAAMINALPTEVTVNDKEAIEAARAAYEALTADQKALVDADTLAKLEAAEEALAAAEQAAADQAAADAVADTINSLPTEVTVNDKEAIEAARAAYAALTDAQKDLVDAETLAKLEAAEEALAAADQAAADQAAADAVAAMINNLPNPENVTVDDKDAIETTGYALAALTNAQRALINPAVIARYRAIAEAFAAVDQAAADQAAAQGVTYLINQIPAEVTENDKETVEKARKAYNMLTDAQKELLAPETLAKLEAAEKALIPELVNESYIENDVSEMKIGNSITVICDSTGGAGTKQYEVWYKRSTATKWTKAQSSSDNTSVSITPKHTGEYTVSVKVKDEAGTAVKKRMSFTVTTDLENTSEISASAILKGDSITVTCASTGGVGTKQYEVWYKRSTATKWTKAQSLSANTSVSITPKHIGEYTISVKVKDEAGIAIKKYIPLTVTTDLENTSEISASAISKGDSITATCASTGGVGTKEYEVWYKHSTATKWTRVQRFSTNTSVVITPKHTGEYTVSVKVKDEVGTAIKKRMPLTVS